METPRPPARLRDHLPPADLQQLRMLTEDEISTIDERADRQGWMHCDEGYSPCGCLDQRRFADGFLVRNPEAADEPLTELDAWLAGCGVPDDERAQIVYDETTGVGLPWAVVARHMASALLGGDDLLVTAADGGWMLGICHHDILTFGRVPPSASR